MRKILILLFITLINSASTFPQTAESQSTYKYFHSGYAHICVGVSSSNISADVYLRVYYFNLGIYDMSFIEYYTERKYENLFPWCFGPFGLSVPIHAGMDHNITANANLYYLILDELLEDYRESGIGYELCGNLEFGMGKISLGYRDGPTFNHPDFGKYKLFNGLFIKLSIGIVYRSPYSKAERIKMIK